jgi:CheY-like chemotaxis protein
VFNDDYKTIQKMTPALQRVLVIDPTPAGARLVGELMRSIARSQVWTASSTDKALGVCRMADPQIVFVELSGPGVDGAAFTKQLRRSDLACRQAPVVMITATATAASIMAARDAGVHEFLRKPFTTKDLLRRLEAVTLRPRDWIEAVGYVGPDRRRFNSGDYSGPLKRRSDPRETPDTARMVQAMKILHSAVIAFDTDPMQALRSLQAQVDELQRLGVTLSNLALTTTAADFKRYLTAASEKGPLKAADVAEAAKAILAFLPKESPAAPRDSAAA